MTVSKKDVATKNLRGGYCKKSTLLPKRTKKKKNEKRAERLELTKMKNWAAPYRRCRHQKMISLVKKKESKFQ